MLVIAAVIWLASRYCKRGEDREEADTMVASLLVAGVMPDLFNPRAQTASRPHNKRTQKRHSVFRRCLGLFPLRPCYSPRRHGAIGCPTYSQIAPTIRLVHCVLPGGHQDINFGALSI
jgi:hypothetical protein